jgi:hypothetical protein
MEAIRALEEARSALLEISGAMEASSGQKDESCTRALAKVDDLIHRIDAGLSKSRRPSDPPRPTFDAMVPEQERLAIEFCMEIGGQTGRKGSLPDPVRLLEMAEALYLAEADHVPATTVTPSPHGDVAVTPALSGMDAVELRIKARWQVEWLRSIDMPGTADVIDALLTNPDGRTTAERDVERDATVAALLRVAIQSFDSGGESMRSLRSIAVETAWRMVFVHADASFERANQLCDEDVARFVHGARMSAGASE